MIWCLSPSFWYDRKIIFDSFLEPKSKPILLIPFSIHFLLHFAIYSIIHFMKDSHHWTPPEENFEEDDFDWMNWIDWIGWKDLMKLKIANFESRAKVKNLVGWESFLLRWEFVRCQKYFASWWDYLAHSFHSICFLKYLLGHLLGSFGNPLLKNWLFSKSLVYPPESLDPPILHSRFIFHSLLSRSLSRSLHLSIFGSPLHSLLQSQRLLAEVETMEQTLESGHDVFLEKDQRNQSPWRPFFLEQRQRMCGFVGDLDDSKRRFRICRNDWTKFFNRSGEGRLK